MGECSDAGLSRREALAVIGGSAISAAAISGTSSARSLEGGKMTYVLIHPAWFGGWCWKKLTPLLRAQGHEVFTPTLTGLGERGHLARPDIGLEIHVRDIINVIEYEDLRNVILVGNSSGGMVITGVADHMPERIAHGLSGRLRADGWPEHAGRDPARSSARSGSVRAEGRRRLAAAAFRAAAMGKTCHRNLASDRKEGSRLDTTPAVPNAVRPFQGAGEAQESCRREVATHLRTQWPHPGFDRYAGDASEAAGWQSRKIASSHLPYITHPSELAALLLEVAG